MKQITQEELDSALLEHNEWINQVNGVNPLKFNDVCFEGLTFEWPLSKASFTKCRFYQCNFLKTTASNTKFMGCDFLECNFKNLILDRSDISSSFHSCDFNEVCIKNPLHSTGVYLGCTFNSSVIENVNMPKSNFSNTSFNNTIFSKVNFGFILDDSFTYVDFNNVIGINYAKIDVGNYRLILVELHQTIFAIQGGVFMELKKFNEYIFRKENNDIRRDKLAIDFLMSKLK